MKTISTADLRGWLGGSGRLSDAVRSIGEKRLGAEWLEGLGVPVHLQFLAERLRSTEGTREVPTDALASIPFYSLCRGLFLPLSSISPERAASLFGLVVPPPPGTEGRRELVFSFMAKDLGLSPVQQIAALLGDPFRGQKSTIRRGTLLALLTSLEFLPRPELLERLTKAGDIAILFAERAAAIRTDRPLTAAEVLETVRFLPDAAKREKFDVLRSLLARMGKLEAYFLARLCLRKAAFGFEYQGSLLAEALARRFDAPAEAVTHATALTDPFRVAEILSTEGPAGLTKIRLAPLVAIRPALASGTVEEVETYPVWVERKYDGIRFLLHKSTDATGAILAAAYTRNRHDWIELVPGLEAAIRFLPARTAIVDGELYGTVVDLERGTRPASVYEVHAVLQGAPIVPVQLRFAGFDLLYLDGADLTPLPLRDRRTRLSMLLAPLLTFPLPIPFAIASGQLAESKDDVNRLYHHFRSQGYEGIVVKDLSSPYRIATRDPSWKKRKPEVTLDLVLLGAVYAVTTKEKAGLFGSYVIGARAPDGSYQDVGDVAGVDRVRDAEIQGEILREGLATGERFERASATGVRPGIALRPHLVATIRFEGVVRDNATAKLSLRDPKLASLRPDKTPDEANSLEDIHQLHVAERIG